MVAKVFRWLNSAAYAFDIVVRVTRLRTYDVLSIRFKVKRKIFLKFFEPPRQRNSYDSDQRCKLSSLVFCEITISSTIPTSFPQRSFTFCV